MTEISSILAGRILVSDGSIIILNLIILLKNIFSKYNINVNQTLYIYIYISTYNIKNFLIEAKLKVQSKILKKKIIMMKNIKFEILVFFQISDISINK